MQAAYNLGIKAYGLALKIAALKNPKAKKWLAGRRNWRTNLQAVAQNNPSALWVHAASLGEMEQGLPLIEKWRQLYPHQKIVVSFFSPSGFENFKQQHLVNAVLYLPLDTPTNAQYFVETLKPQKALFIKYEIWVNFFKTLKNNGIPLVLAPAVFRANQLYFSKWAAPFFLPVLKNISAILVQNKGSLQVLKNHGLQNVSLCGDTRFDRVKTLVNSAFDTQKLDAFIDSQFCVIGGSSWPAEEEILYQLLEKEPQVKLILAPHLIDSENIERLQGAFSAYGVNLYTQDKWLKSKRVLLVNTMGHLSKIYRVGNLAFVGGGFGEGVHSTVEPIGYKIPVCFGPNHKKFVEPKEMLARKIGFEIHNASDLIAVAKASQKPQEQRKINTAINRYLSEKTGATEKITAVLADL